MVHDEKLEYKICTNSLRDIWILLAQMHHKGFPCNFLEKYREYDNCENLLISADLCEGITCNNQGTCEEGECVCHSNFSGTNCESKLFWLNKWRIYIVEFWSNFLSFWCIFGENLANNRLSPLRLVSPLKFWIRPCSPRGSVRSSHNFIVLLETYKNL